VGAGACARHAHRCDLSRGVVTDDHTGTVVFHLARPDPDFLFKLTEFAFSAPVPPGTLERDLRFQPPAGTGPYHVEAADPHRITFVRNRYFREWSHAAQPSGNPNRIVWRFSSSHRQTISWVEQGRADWTFDLIPAAELNEIRTGHPSLLHVNPIDAVDFIPLNSHLAPFNDVRVRRALNLAIDRRRIARMYGGSYVAAPTCQPLVPGLAGYRRYCPYTVDARRDGTYHGPALARAKRLVAKSGTHGERVDVWGATDEFVVPPQEAFYIGDVLRSLGYHARVHSVRFASITEAIRRRIQLSVDGDWVPDYPAPSSYLPQFFGCNGGTSNGYVCNPGLDAEMAHALTLQLTNSVEAAALWRRIDQQITDDAYWVPTVDPRAIELVSTRLRNYEFSPVWGFIADQAWLR
jgi:peptide/nickel transport system substrate-binding protein